MIYQTIDNAGHMMDAFREMGRESQFSYEAMEFLFNFYNDLSEDTGSNIELDPIGICCDWSEYDSVEELASALNVAIDDEAVREDILSDWEDKSVLTEDYLAELIEDRREELIEEMKEHEGVYELENGHFLVEDACI